MDIQDVITEWRKLPPTTKTVTIKMEYMQKLLSYIDDLEVGSIAKKLTLKDTKE